MSRGDWIQTRTGRAYHPQAPAPADVDIRDIAHALSNLCRFGGHCSRFYSVAEHSVLVSHVVPPEHALAGLLHDATEAYVVDLPRPIKHMLPGYVELEARSWAAIAEHFALPADLDPCIKAADNAVLLAEKAALLGPTPYPWTWAEGLAPAPVVVVGWEPGMARHLFTQRFAQIMREQVYAARHEHRSVDQLDWGAGGDRGVLAAHERGQR